MLSVKLNICFAWKSTWKVDNFIHPFTCFFCA